MESNVSRPHPILKGLASTLKILMTGVALPIMVSIATSYYVNTRLLKPKLIVDYAWGDVGVMPVNGTNDFIAVLLDFYPGIEAPLPPGTKTLDEITTPLSSSGGEIVWAKRLRFKSSKDYILESHRRGSRLIKIMITNSGYAPANHIEIGVEIPASQDYKIIPSPNINITDKLIPGTDVTPSFIRVEIDRMAPSEKACLTLVTPQRDESNSPPSDVPFVTINRTFGKSVLYVKSNEGSGVVSEGVSWRDETKWEEDNFPGSKIGFWATDVHPKLGVTPSVEDMKELTLEYELVDDAGKHTANGKFELHPTK